MPKLLTKTVYTFDELNDKAKEKARDWYRNGNLDYEWWDSVFEDASTVADLLGIDINQKPVKLMSGATRYDPAIFFSGFASQGDGAWFMGKYQYKKGALKAVTEHAPEDKTLQAIAKGLQDIQSRNFYQLYADISQYGGYTAIRVSVEKQDNSSVSRETEDAVTKLMTDFAGWIYRRLEAEYEYLNADEQVDENILANEYTFTETGHREG